MSIHPGTALTESGASPPIIPSCVHYAGNERFLRRAFELQDSLGYSFDVCCDLEDGAVRGKEAEQLELVLSLLAERRESLHRVGVRVHGVDTPFFEKELTGVIAAAGKQIAFVTLPKCRSTAEVKFALDTLNQSCKKHSISQPPAVHLLIETHNALRDIWSIAALPGLQALEFGLLDFISDHQGAIGLECLKSPGQFEHHLIVRAKTEIAAAALAHGLVPSHNISLEIRDSAQVYADAKKAHERFGFLRMWSIHPNQIDAISRAFAPNFEEVKKAAKILLTAQDADWGPIQFEGQLVDRASYRIYWTLLKRAKQAGAKLEPEAEKRFFVA